MANASAGLALQLLGPATAKGAGIAKAAGGRVIHNIADKVPAPKKVTGVVDAPPAKQINPAGQPQPLPGNLQANAGGAGGGNALNGLQNAADPKILPPGFKKKKGGGDALVKGVPLKPTVLKDELGRITSSKATIKPKNLFGGIPTTTASRSMTTPNDAGHILGRLLGGKGGAGSNNIFAQNSSINRGRFAKHEGWVADQVRAGKNVEIEVQLIYQGTSAIPVRVKYITTVDGVMTTKISGN